jgi:hypothetical protein
LKSLYLPATRNQQWLQKAISATGPAAEISQVDTATINVAGLEKTFRRAERAAEEGEE